VHGSICSRQVGEDRPLEQMIEAAAALEPTLAEAAFGGTPGLRIRDFQDVPPPAI